MIVAVGRNFAKHAKELGSDIPKAPIIFLKPVSSILRQGSIQLPKGAVVHHEVELAVVMGKKAKEVKRDHMSYVKGYALAIDMTARNFQKQASAQGLPWTVAKGYDTFTPIGPVLDKKLIQDPHKLLLNLQVNGQVKQNGSTEEMIFQVPSLIEHISHIMTLNDNDIILTGTPEGVGPVVDGDVVECYLSQNGKVLSQLKFNAENRK